MELLLRVWNGLTTNLDLVIAGLSLWLVVHLAHTWVSRRSGVSASLEGLDTWIFVGVILGARAGAAVPEAHLYASHPLDLVRINQGLSFYGALAGGAAALTLYAWRHHKPLLPLADAFALFLPLGIGLYRLGCLAYGFCGGKPAPFPVGITLPGHVGTRYPSELLEGLFVLGVFFVLLRLAQRSAPAGIMTGAFLVAYPLLRAAVDLTRFSTGPWPWGDPLASLGVAVLGLAMLLALWLRHRMAIPRSTSKTAAVRPVSEE